MFNETVLKEIEDIRVKYPDRRSALLPSLYIAQREFGWLSHEAMQFVAGTLNLPEAGSRGLRPSTQCSDINPWGVILYNSAQTCPA
jgi:NADH:ubiquinone oxidoreductase subunit E